jgi:histidine triad (HIT) family protein
VTTAQAGCAFCGIVAGQQAAHEVWRDGAAVAFLDRAPLFEGHVLVVPTAHHVTLADLPEGEVGPFFAAVRRVSAALPEALGCTGTFVAMNNVVSQSVPHVHAHVVPRTKGDGLRGFFWPRRRYRDGDHAAEVAAAIAGVLAAGAG